MARYRKGGMRAKGMRNIDIGRVVSKIAYTILSLWVGGTIINEIGNVVLNTSSPFYQGLNLIGWTVQSVNGLSTSACNGQNDTVYTTTFANCVTSTSGSGILGVVGIIGIASIVLEFVEYKF